MSKFIVMPYLKLISLYLILCCFSQTLSAQFYNYPGGIIDLKINKESTDLPEIKYGLNDVIVLDEGDQWRILIGIDLETLPGDYLLYIKHPNEEISALNQKFSVAQKQPSFLLDPQVNGYPVALNEEKFSDITFNNSVEPILPLSYPAIGQWTDKFGAIDTSNEGGNIFTRNYISLTTTQALPVTAPHNAIVTRVFITPNSTENRRPNLNLSNNNPPAKENYSIVLDHGRGLYSILTGITDITVEPSNGVRAGAVLGKIYSRNFSSNEPNTLIWQTVLNEAYVNPVILTQLR